MTTDPRPLALRAIDRLAPMIAGLGPDDLDRSTPCADWRVRELLAHIAETADALSGLTVTGERTLPGEPAQRADPQADAIRALHELRDRITRDPGADLPGQDRAAGDAAVEFTVHSWDLDPSRRLPADLADGVLDIVRPAVDDELRRSFFAPQVEVPEQAAASDRLVAFLGRPPEFARSRR